MSNNTYELFWSSGTVEFPNRAGSTYRCELCASLDIVTIWVEDRRTKQQW